MTRKKLLILIGSVVLALVMVVMACAGPAPAPPREFLTIGTGSPGGVYYPLGGGLAVIIEKKTDYRSAAESTSASVENNRLVATGKIDMGFSEAGMALFALEGKEPFKEAMPLAALFNFYSSALHLVVLKDSGITSLSDMKGKRVATAEPASATYIDSGLMLQAVGIDQEKDLAKLATLQLGERAAAFKDGLVDVMFYEAGFPNAGIMDVATARNIDIISLSESEFEKVIESQPWSNPITIPAGTYRGVDYDVFAKGMGNLIVVNQAMSDDLAYELVKVIFANITEGKYALADIHPSAKQLTLENAVRTSIPLHPGAIRYYKEQGVID